MNQRQIPPQHKHWKEFTRPATTTDFGKVKEAYAAGDYTTVIELLDSKMFHNIGQRSKGIATTPNAMFQKEYALLVRAMCSQQLRDFDHKKDQKLCNILALWLKSLALESLERWELANRDLTTLKSMIINTLSNNLKFNKDSLLSILLPYMAPLVLQYNNNAWIVNLRCVNDKLRFIMNMLTVKQKSLSNGGDGQLSSSMINPPRLIDDDGKSSCDLAKKFHYRLLLRRPLHPNIHLDMWYTMDLMFVSEMGLFKREDMYGAEGYALACKILEIGEVNIDNNKYSVEVRPMSSESCEWSGLTATDWAGVQKSGKVLNQPEKYLYVYPIMEMADKSITINLSNGGQDNHNNYSNFNNFNNLNDFNSNNANSNNTNGNNTNGNNANTNIPVAFGPIFISDCKSHPSTCAHHQADNSDLNVDFNDLENNNDDDDCDYDDDSFNYSSSLSSSLSSLSSTSSSPSFEEKEPVEIKKKIPWSNDEYLIENYRIFDLPNGKNLLIKELWDVGIPGKVWDSAFVMVQLFREKLANNKRLFDNKKILDLSSGNGFVGTHLAALITDLKVSNDYKKNDVADNVMTDLKHALPLIKKNISLNRYLLGLTDKISINVEYLKWGDLNKAKKLGTLDYVLASDVVYEPELFDSLIQTLNTLCTPNLTKIYLGYKRRGLTKNEEKDFFNQLQKNFNMKLLTKVGDNIDGEVCDGGSVGGQINDVGIVNLYELWK
ncbi:8215_t:CDS:2 [Entrophospora sp. SA101]|nr:5122_t:CDS:2 [Entrophospora sp. SA101]CAJ0826593.1 8215_t:CDS:2 [Entrophospora sp. SA101]